MKGNYLSSYIFICIYLVLVEFFGIVIVVIIVVVIVVVIIYEFGVKRELEEFYSEVKEP